MVKLKYFTSNIRISFRTLIYFSQQDGYLYTLTQNKTKNRIQNTTKNETHKLIRIPGDKVLTKRKPSHTPRLPPSQSKR